jgi:predicted nucleotidyltransferase
MTYILYNLFGSKTRTGLITKLMMEPDRSFYIRELSRETQIPYGMVYKELENLEKIGLIEKEKKGKITLIRVNKDLSYYKDLRNLLMKTTGFSHIILDRVKDLLGLEYVLIFGSAASGEDISRSDIDLLIIGEVDELKLLNLISEAENLTGREINYILWSSMEFEKKIKEKNHLLLDIVEKPVILLRGDEDEFTGSIKRGMREESQDK